MAIPHDDDIMRELLKMLSMAPNYTMHCHDVYRELAKKFSELTYDDTNVPYRHSFSKWANRVQFARLHCVQYGYIYSARAAQSKDRGYWTITDKGLSDLKKSM